MFLILVVMRLVEYSFFTSWNLFSMFRISLLKSFQVASWMAMKWRWRERIIQALIVLLLLALWVLTRKWLVWVLLFCFLLVNKSILTLTLSLWRRKLFIVMFLWMKILLLFLVLLSFIITILRLMVIRMIFIKCLLLVSLSCR